MWIPVFYFGDFRPLLKELGYNSSKLASSIQWCMLEKAGDKEGRWGEMEKRSKRGRRRQGKEHCLLKHGLLLLALCLWLSPPWRKSQQIWTMGICRPCQGNPAYTAEMNWAAGRRSEEWAADSALMALVGQQPLMLNNELLNSDLLIKPQREQWRKLALQRETETGACCAFINSPSTLSGILSEADIFTNHQTTTKAVFIF